MNDMFVKSFHLIGFCVKKSDMLAADGKLQGYYFQIATVGDSVGVYAPAGCPGADMVKEDLFCDIVGELKSKKATSGCALTAHNIALKENPFNGKK